MAGSVGTQLGRFGCSDPQSGSPGPGWCSPVSQRSPSCSQLAGWCRSHQHDEPDRDKNIWFKFWMETTHWHNYRYKTNMFFFWQQTHNDPHKHLNNYILWIKLTQGKRISNSLCPQHQAALWLLHVPVIRGIQEIIQDMCISHLDTMKLFSQNSEFHKVTLKYSDFQVSSEKGKCAFCKVW